MKHTKGTWYSSESVNIHEQRIIADEETGQTIAVCYGRGGHDVRESETEANAHLIASAPELLEACKAALAAINLRLDVDGGKTGAFASEINAVLLLEKAIAKAEAT